MVFCLISPEIRSVHGWGLSHSRPLKMKIIEVYNGLPDLEDDSFKGNSEEENTAVEISEGEKSEDESSEVDGDTYACFCFLSIINDFEDALSEQERGRLEQYEQEAIEEIIEEEEKDTKNDNVEL